MKIKSLFVIIFIVMLSACSGGFTPEESGIAEALTSQASFAGKFCKRQKSEYIFCDDFDSDLPLEMSGRYFEAINSVVVDESGLNGSRAFAGNFLPGKKDAGSLKVSFGQVPIRGSGIQPDQKHREIFYRFYLKTDSNWSGQPDKLSRATSLITPSWGQAMVAHLWGDNALGLSIDPVSCVVNGNTPCQTYNDFGSFNWLGNKSGSIKIYQEERTNTWFCIENQVRLNDSGESNGIQRLWIDDQLQFESLNLDFVGDYSEYGINAVFLENFRNTPFERAQSRFIDDFIISTSRIGCE